MKKKFISAACVFFWLFIWQLGAVFLGQEILLVSPIQASVRLFELIPTVDFQKSVCFSAGRIILGFALGLAGGSFLAALAGRFSFLKSLFSPLISAVKAVPVASITILVLIWVSSRNLSVIVSFMISFPVVYSNMLEGIENLDPELNEMAELFRIPALRKFTGVYLPQLMPYFRASVRLAVGLSWKSGAAAEIIGIPSGSIGEKLYEAKIYLETADLFAWTIAVVLLSWLSEKAMLLLADAAASVIAGGIRQSRFCGKNDHAAPVGIVLDSVSKSYGENSILTDFSAEFSAGSLTAVVGASGCGKTTLLSLLSGIIQPDSGEIRTDPTQAAFAAVFQEDRLCEGLTVCANIRLVNSRLSDDEIASALGSVGLSGCENKPARELSGGMKRRAALVRALLSDYSAIVLDEPFKGLDDDTKQQVLGYCRKMLKGKTAVLVTHDVTEAEQLGAEKKLALNR